MVSAGPRARGTSASPGGRRRNLAWSLLRVAVAAAALVAVALPAHAQSLRPTRSSLDRQNLQARTHDYTFLEDEHQVAGFVRAGLLVPVPGNGDYVLKEGVSFPYARPEVVDFLARLGTRYRESCGEQLVVTSLTRPRNRQPPNASRRSVHPTGMAFDLRKSWSRSCRGFLEGVLVALEAKGVLEANRERYPPHYHVALFPRPYQQLLASGEPLIDEATHVVTVGDTLWRIAHRYGTTVGLIKAANGLRSNVIRPGQMLTVPGLR